MRIALIAAVLLTPLSEAASLTGSVVDVTGAYIPRAGVELDSSAQKYQTQTDDAGVYQFANLPAGEYTLTIRVPGFRYLTIRAIRLLDPEQKRIPDVPLEIATCPWPPSRDLILLAPGDTFGRLAGSVTPPMAEVEVTLVCRTFSPCRSAKTDSTGRFVFETLSPGVYGLNFRRDGFYPVNATGYSYTVNVGWESRYYMALARCPNGNCDPKLRPKRPLAICE